MMSEPHWTDKHIEQSEFGYAAYDEAGLIHGYYDSHESAKAALIRWANILDKGYKGYSVTR